MKIGLRLHGTLFMPNLIKYICLWMLMSTSRSLRLLTLLYVFKIFSILDADIAFSAHHPLPKTSLTSCQHFLPLQSLTSMMSWIIISALTLSMLPMLLLGGMRSGSFILTSTVWHWITWLFLVSSTYVDTHFSYTNCYLNQLHLLMSSVCLVKVGFFSHIFAAAFPCNQHVH